MIRIYRAEYARFVGKIFGEEINMQDVEKRMLSEISSQVGDVTIPAEFWNRQNRYRGCYCITVMRLRK